MFLSLSTKNICCTRDKKKKDRVSRQRWSMHTNCRFAHKRTSFVYDLQTVTCSCHYLHEASLYWFVLLVDINVRKSSPYHQRRENKKEKEKRNLGIRLRRGWCLISFVFSLTDRLLLGLERVQSHKSYIYIYIEQNEKIIRWETHRCNTYVEILALRPPTNSHPSLSICNEEK